MTDCAEHVTVTLETPLVEHVTVSLAEPEVRVVTITEGVGVSKSYVDARTPQITVSTTAPSSPAVNDIWVDSSP
jgi:hypothetical protein